MKTLADLTLEDFGIDPEDAQRHDYTLGETLYHLDYQPPVFEGDSVIDELFEELDFEQEVQKNYERKSNV